MTAIVKSTRNHEAIKTWAKTSDLTTTDTRRL